MFDINLHIDRILIFKFKIYLHLHCNTSFSRTQISQGGSGGVSDDYMREKMRLPSPESPYSPEVFRLYFLLFLKGLSVIRTRGIMTVGVLTRQ